MVRMILVVLMIFLTSPAFADPSTFRDLIVEYDVANAQAATLSLLDGSSGINPDAYLNSAPATVTFVSGCTVCVNSTLVPFLIDVHAQALRPASDILVTADLQLLAAVRIPDFSDFA